MVARKDACRAWRDSLGSGPHLRLVVFRAGLPVLRFQYGAEESDGNCELDFVRDLFPIAGVVGGSGRDAFGLGQLDAPVCDAVGLTEDAGGFAVHGNGFHDPVVVGGASDMEPVACFVDTRDDGARRKVVHGME